MVVVVKVVSCLLLLTWVASASYGFESEGDWIPENEDDFDELLPLFETRENQNTNPELDINTRSNDEPNNSQQKETECTTPACQKLKESFLSKMDTKVKPCDDMYRYSCGKFFEREEKRKPQRDMSTFNALVEYQTKKLIKIIEGLKNSKENDVNKKVYDWYSACLNDKQKKKLGPSPLVNTLKAIGSWPVLDEDWDEFSFDLESVLAAVNKEMSIFPLFNVGVENDARNYTGTPYGLSITKPDLGLDVPEFYLKQTQYSDVILFAYFKLLYKLNLLIGGKDSILSQAFGSDFKKPDDFKNLDENAGLLIDMIKVVKFEMDIAKAITLDRKFYLVSPYTTLGELRNKISAFDWKRYISLLYKDIPKQPSFTDDEVIYIEHPEFFKRIMVLFEITEPRVIANYISSKVIFAYAGTLSKDFREAYLEFYAAAYGLKSPSPRNVVCVRSVSKSLMYPVTALFVKDNLPEKDLVKAEAMVLRLTEAYLNHLSNSVEWMDNVTRQAAIRKVNLMLAHVGYPREIRNKTLLDHLYKEVEVDPMKYYENVLKLNYIRTRNTLLSRGTFPRRDRWDMTLTQANAQYSPSGNKITVAAGLLQPPLFNRDYPRACTFGSIGMAIGHEMTHGFDAHGSRFDGHGNVNLWWTKQTLKTFLDKAKCMINQYSTFKLYKEHLHGKQTLDENIADNGGLKIAYEAYLRSLKVSGPDQSLPGIKLTSKQLFFVSFGQLWCKHRTKASAINSLHTDEHSPAKARVNFVLKNMKEFSDAFNCPKGSPMNPEKKCVIW